MKRNIYTEGERSFRLRLVRFSRLESGIEWWVAACDCGKEIEVRATLIRIKKKKSCGCLLVDAPRERNTTHGKTKTPEFRVWATVRYRCSNINHSKYKYYGGRGIFVCERWSVFPNFLDDMGERPSKAHTIERVDNNKGYSPDNCIWALQAQQNRNKRNNVIVVLHGESVVLADACRILKMKDGLIYYRMSKYGVTPQQAVDFFAKECHGA